ncbi:hypothetical protein Taro_007615 [Colocasia esculenta]|uniref:Uncharacterized protein n=1 Tax=Colocasia esculenta TaxID=4460 RepID=A0A843TZG8_COLES|nr:hypothetical protein [Colocasia esculenta]
MSCPARKTLQEGAPGVKNPARAAMDSSNRNLEDASAVAISSSQEEILRRSLFVASGGSHSSPSSSSSGGSGPGGAPYWISHRAVTMRSASDSHHSSSPSSSSDARSGGGRGGSEVARSPGAEESLGDGDGGEGSGVPGDRGDRIVGRVRRKSCVSKRKGSAAGKRVKRSRPLSEQSTQEPEESPVVSPRGKGVRKSGKEAVGTARGDGDPRTDPPGVEDEGGDRSANDELARFRYVRTGVPPLRHSPPELLKDALGSPKSARGGARSPPQQRSPVTREPADGEVMKGVALRSPQGSGKGVIGLNTPSPSTPDEADGERSHGSGSSARSHGSPPLGAGPSTSVQHQNSVAPEEEGPPALGLGSSTPVETPQQPAAQRAVEKSPSGDAPSLASPTESAPGGEDTEIRRSSDLVDLLIKFSKKPDRRLENVDFLEVLAMKGIHIPPPRWWRPGGYGPKKVRN